MESSGGPPSEAHSHTLLPKTSTPCWVRSRSYGPAQTHGARARSEQRHRPASAQRAHGIRASAPTSRRLVRRLLLPTHPHLHGPRRTRSPSYPSHRAGARANQRASAHLNMCTPPHICACEYARHQKPSDAIRGHQRPSEAIRGRQMRPSEAI